MDTEVEGPKRSFAGGDVFETNDKIFKLGSAKIFILIYILWNAILACLFLLLNLCSETPSSIICLLPFIGACFVFTFALKMKSKMIFGILAVYTMVSLGNKLFKMTVGLNDGDWFHRCFLGSVETFQSIITILHSIFQALISLVLIRMSFWEMNSSCCCCHCCIICCCCCPCFQREYDGEWDRKRSEKCANLSE